MSLLSFIQIIGWILGIFMFIFWIMGFVAAINEEEKTVPLIGGITLLK